MEIQLFVIIVLFSVIQSIFGMGLLVFGTPTLLLLGHSFSEVLSILLPPSLTISFIQVIRNKTLREEYVFDLLKYCLPFIAITLIWKFLTSATVNLYLFVACVLVISALSRLSKKISLYIQLFIQRNSRIYLILMGTIHGLSNMGGSMLSVYAISQHGKKDATLNCVATGYLLFTSIQLMVLTFVNEISLGITTIISCLIAMFSYFLIGDRIYSFVNDNLYQTIFTAFMLIYAALLILSNFGSL